MLETALGTSPSPQAFSIGGVLQSRTVTRSPLRVAAIAVAMPAGPAPITRTSARLSRTCHLSPSEQYQLGAKSRAHGRENAQRTRFGTSVQVHVFEHQKDRRGRNFSYLAQTFPRRGQVFFLQAQGSRRCLQNLGAAGMHYPGLD